MVRDLAKNGWIGNRGTESGFSLIEVLVAMVILVSGMASILALFISAVSIHKAAVDGTHCTLIAESAFSTARARLAEGDVQPVARRPALDFPGYDVQIDIEPIDGVVGGEVAVKVTVFWRTGKGEGSESFAAILPTDDFRGAIEAAVRR